MHFYHPADYCIYNQWFENGLQAPKPIKCSLLAEVKKTGLNERQVQPRPPITPIRHRNHQTLQRHRAGTHAPEHRDRPGPARANCP